MPDMYFKRACIFYAGFLLLTVFNCKRVDRVEPSNNDQLQVYNDVLDQLVRNRFYYRYLSEEKMDSLWLHYNHNIDDKSDSIEFHKYVDKITREVESDTGKQKSIRLAKGFGIGFERFSQYIVSDSNRYYDDIRNSLSILPYDLKSICDSLATPQGRFKAEDFYSKVFKVSSYEDEVGVVGFSKLLFNESNDIVILYYEFRCGGTCGFGEILIVQKKGKHWSIKETHHLWIS